MNISKIIVVLTALTLSFGCVTERIIVETEEIGCETDAECNDRRPETDDWCDVGSGVCNHAEFHDRACMSFVDCDDGEPATIDACEDGVCHHTRETNAFNPGAPERQDAYLICETNHDIRWADLEPPVAHLTLEGCSEPSLWNEYGYRMTVIIHGFETDETARVRIAPQLRVGDPADRYRVTVSVYEEVYPPTVVLAGEYSVPEIEEGFDVTVSSSIPGPVVGGTQIVLRFWPIGDVRSRAIQWALPVDGVTRLDDGPEISTAPASSWFTRIPRHGFLRLTEGPSGEMQCAGEVLELDVQPGEHIPGGFVREEDDPEVFHLTDFRSPRLLQRFQGVRGGIDWFDHWLTACASVHVVPNGSLSEDPDWESELVGIRPGRIVAWMDWATRVRRVGYTERGFVIRDVGSYDDRGGFPGFLCTRYSSWSTGSFECELDVTDMLREYTILPAMEPLPWHMDVDVYPIWSYSE